MTNYNTEFLAKYGLDKELYVVYRPYVDFVGHKTAGMMLGRLLYWRNKGEAGDGWIYKSDADWQEELCTGRDSIRKAREILEKTGFVQTRCSMVRAKGSQTTYYKIEIEEFEKRFDEWFRSQALSENEQCLPNDSQGEPEALSENRQVIVGKQTGHCRKTDRSLSENRQPITREYSREYPRDTQERGGAPPPEPASSSQPPVSLSLGGPSVLDAETTNGVTTDGPPSSPSSAPPQVPAGRKHPAIVAYREIVRRDLEERQVERVIAQVGHEPDSLDRWRAALQGWIDNGHRQSNLQGMLDWHRDGKTGYQQNGARASPGQKRTAATRNQPTEEERREQRNRSQPLR